jgi:hypothetical protein
VGLRGRRSPPFSRLRGSPGRHGSLRHPGSPGPGRRVSHRASPVPIPSLVRVASLAPPVSRARDPHPGHAATGGLRRNTDRWRPVVSYRSEGE